MEKLNGKKKLIVSVFISGRGTNLNSLINFSKRKDSLGLYELLVKEKIIDKSVINLALFEKYISPSFFYPFELDKSGTQFIFQFYRNQLKEPLRSGVIDKSVDLPFLWMTYLIFLSLFEKLDFDKQTT